MQDNDIPGPGYEGQVHARSMMDQLDLITPKPQASTFDVMTKSYGGTAPQPVEFTYNSPEGRQTVTMWLRTSNTVEHYRTRPEPPDSPRYVRQPVPPGSPKSGMTAEEEAAYIQRCNIFEEEIALYAAQSKAASEEYWKQQDDYLMAYAKWLATFLVAIEPWSFTAPVYDENDVYVGEKALEPLDRRRPETYLPFVTIHDYVATFASGKGYKAALEASLGN